MSNTAELNKSNKLRIWGRFFIGILVIQGVIELLLGGAILYDFPAAVESGFGIIYRNELDILGVALGLYLLLLALLMILSGIWVYRINHSGITLGLIVGGFLIAFGLATFMKLGDTSALIGDGSRGLLTIVIGFMARREFKQS